MHGFRYVGPAKAPRGDSACERPQSLGCTRCGLLVTVDCHSTRTKTCGPCGLRYRDSVRMVARVHDGSVGLLTITGPGVQGHKRNVGGKRVSKRGTDGKLHTVWKGGRWIDCDCWRGLGDGPGTWNASLGKRWNRLWNNGVRRDPALAWLDGAYFRAVEDQKRGLLHLHVIVKVRPGLVVTDVMLEAVEALAVQHGFGHVVDFQPVEGKRAAGYVAKYVSKGANDRPNVPWHRVKSRPAKVAAPPSPEYALRNEWVVMGPLPVRMVEYVQKRATYRTWSASRDWPRTMRELREARQHFADLGARVLDWTQLQEWSEAAPGFVAEAFPDRPDLPPPP